MAAQIEKGTYINRHPQPNANSSFITVRLLLQVFGYPKLYTPSTRFSDARVKRSESHAILDFMAGKDVGLGLFGRHASSVLSAGVRYVQFSEDEGLIRVNAVQLVEDAYAADRPGSDDRDWF